MLRFLILTALTSNAIASSRVFKDGPCPPVKTKANFDFNSYSGTWYQMARFPNFGEELDRGKCTTAQYYVDGNRGKVRNTHVVDGLMTYIDGDITLIGPGKIMLTYTFGDEAKNSYLYILDTDYKNYSIGYSCRYFKDTGKHQIFSWIKSRGKSLSSSVKDAVEKFLQENTSIIDASKYITNDHSDKTCKAHTIKPITEFIVYDNNPNYIE